MNELGRRKSSRRRTIREERQSKVPIVTVSRSVGTMLSLSLSMLVFAVIYPTDIDATRPFSSIIMPAASTFGIRDRRSPSMWRSSSPTRRCRNGYADGRTLTNSRLKNVLQDDILRGGSTEVDDEEVIDSITDGKVEVGAAGTKMNETLSNNIASDQSEEDNDSDSKDEVGNTKEPTTINERVNVIIQTNWGSSILDQNLELEVARSRNIAKIKESVSRQMPGKPPVLGLKIVYEGRVLDDDVLLDELFEDDDDDEEGESRKSLILNVVPPVDPRFATELIPKISPHSQDDDKTLTTEDLLNAYFLNQVAMTRNAELLANPNADGTLLSPLLRLQMKEQAEELKQQLQLETPTDVWKKALEPVPRNAEQRRGNRYRSGMGGASTSIRRSLQTNLNVDWGVTIWNFVLFLFFGYFGTSRGSLSRFLLLWAAPLSIAVQARPVKMWIKVLFYSMHDLPSVVLSLLPAPQQAIMGFNMDESYKELYGTTSSGGGEGKKDVSKLDDSAQDDDDEDEFDDDDDELDDEDDIEDADDEE